VIPICLAFTAHLPTRLRAYDYFDVGRRHDYFDTEAMARRLARADALCYRPAADMLARLLDRHPRFSFSLALSGPLMDQLAAQEPERLLAFRRLVASGRVEPLSATSHHCLPWAVSPAELETQIRLHRRRIRRDLGREPKVFGGEEPSDAPGLAALAAPRRFSGLLLSGGPLASQVERHRVYRVGISGGIPAMVRDEGPFEEAARRCSDRGFLNGPPTAEKLNRWISSAAGDILFFSMDLEAFGRRHPRDTGVLALFEAWIGRIVSRPDSRFLTPSDAFARIDASEALPRDLPPARAANELQQDARECLAVLESRVRAAGTAPALEDFRRLTGSDHFDRMTLSARGDAPAGAGAADSPYEVYMAFRHAVTDLERRLGRSRRATLVPGPTSA
jgi:alpha-amylase